MKIGEKEKQIVPEQAENLSSKITSFDIKVIIGLILVYMVFALFNLGTTQSPKTYYHFLKNGESVGLELTSGEQNVNKIRYYNGPEVGEYTIMVSNDGKDYTNLLTFNAKSVFAWEEIEIDAQFKYIMFLCSQSGSYLGEVQLYNNYGDKILAKASSVQAEVLVDELDTVPAKISYQNSSYFDEIYFARSAYEYTHDLNAMEWTHPPLGKLLMTLPIILFGFSPFTYRLMGVIAGILMIPVIYILAKKLFKKTKWAFLAGVLMAFDNFHLAHTRLATVDSFLVLFILLSCLFMKKFFELDKEEKFKNKAVNLLLSGFFIGCAIATKWTGLYALLGLGILFFCHLFKQYEDGRRKKFNALVASRATLYGLVVLGLVPIILYYLSMFILNSTTATTIMFCYYVLVGITVILVLIKTLLCKDIKLSKLFIVCIVAFVFIPITIYVLSYVLFPNVALYTNSFSGLISQTQEMYRYHSTLTETHPFQSKWYEWPLMIKPVWYYVGYYGSNVKSTIVGIGNPIIWWFGIIAAIFTFVKTIIKKEKETLFISILILSTFVPYVFIGRAMFMYHYFPTLPFVMLAIVELIKWITEKMKSNMVYIFYIVLVIVFFLVFYPISSGMVTTTEYIDSLKWLSSWIF